MILHIDLDCFFVAAARTKDPSLKGKKVAVVGGNSSVIFGEKESVGGVVLSASYEARKDGVCSALSLKKAQNLCKDLIVVKADHALYKEFSNKLYKLLYNYTPDIEQFSIDEFFVDLNGIEANDDPLNFAHKLQDEILSKLNLPASIGISEAKYIAKLTTDLVKPYGVGMVRVCEIKDKLGDIDIAKFPGVGARIKVELNRCGVYTINDVFGAKFLFEKFGKNGIKLYESITGEGLNTLEFRRVRKSFSHARTFDVLMDRDEVERRILILCRYLSFDIHKFGKSPTKFDFKLRYLPRETHSKSVTLKESFSQSLLDKVMLTLFREIDRKKSIGISYISVGVGSFVDAKIKTLFSDESRTKLDDALQEIREKHGIELLKTAKEIR
ncbi:MAG: DNA polymerase IV [Campylobacter sp.]|nr:DNA polymerase IV [Campylobacter sp.]